MLGCFLVLLHGKLRLATAAKKGFLVRDCGEEGGCLITGLGCWGLETDLSCCYSLVVALRMVGVGQWADCRWM